MVDIKLTLPDDFLEEEVRCDYTVSAKQKEVWAVELDLLAEFKRVCDKHGLKYWVDGGTLLGAIRHKGFIPWDDDVDLVMFRDEYDRLCKIAEDEFDDPYFFQTEYTDPGSIRRHAQLRNTKTTAMLVEEKDKKYGFCQGIFIDIFPLDRVPDDKLLYEEQKRELRELKRHISLMAKRNMDEGNLLRRVLKRALRRFYLLTGQNTIYFYRRFEEVCARYNESDSEMLQMMSLDFTNEKFCKPASSYDDTIEVPFEMLSFPAPAGYERILEISYGNWREFVRQGSYHGGVYFDTDKPYTEYINKN